MPLLFATQSFAARIIAALCWMLVHSLWQGLLLAAAAGVTILFTKRTSPAVRYNLLGLASLLFISGTVVTFLVKLYAVPESSFTTTALQDAMSSGSNLTLLATTLTTGDDSAIARLVSFLNEYATVIVSSWFLVIGFRCVRLITSLTGIQKLKNTAASSPGEYWNDRIQVLSSQLGIKKQVRLLQSGIIKIPMVLGYLKPVILFPVGVLAALPPDEVEAILAHELAHIRRNDYLVNILQSFMEIVFFFNPAATWVSSLIKTERENCCDDIAVVKAASKRSYINALLSFQELHLAVPTQAMTLGTKKEHLLQRVNRIIYNNNKTLNAMEKIFLASGLLLTGLFVVAFSFNDPKLPVNKNVGPPQSTLRQQPPVAGPSTDTIPVVPESGASKIITTVNGEAYVINLNGDAVTALQINGKKIPSEKIADHRLQLQKIINDVRQQGEKARILAIEASQQEAKLKMEMERLQQMSGELNSNQAKLHREDMKKQERELERAQMALKAQLEKLNAEGSMLRNTNGNMKMAEQERAMAYQKEKINATQRLQWAKGNNSIAPRAKLMEALDLQIESEHLKLAKLHAEREMLQGTLANAQAMKEQEAARNVAGTGNALSVIILEDLVHKGIIMKGEKAVVHLNKKEFTINGVKQPTALHQEFKEKYVKSPGWNFNFTY